MEELQRKFKRFLEREDVPYTEKKLRILYHRKRLEHKIKSAHNLMEACGIIETIEILEMGLDFLETAERNSAKNNLTIESIIEMPALYLES